MPTYEFVCDGCSGLTFVAKTRHPTECPLGHAQIQRRYGFAGFVRKWDGGFSPATGKYAANDREFDDQLKAASEAASEELGMEHRFRPMDPRDTAGLGVTEE